MIQTPHIPWPMRVLLINLAAGLFVIGSVVSWSHISQRMSRRRQNGQATHLLQQCQQLQQKLTHSKPLPTTLDPDAIDTAIVPRLQSLPIHALQLDHTINNTTFTAFNGSCSWSTLTHLINALTDYRLPWQLKMLNLQRQNSSIVFEIHMQEQTHV